MLTGIDHIAIVVTDLKMAIRDYTEQGFTVVPGGRHPLGTHNALISLADGSYIEIIAFYEPNSEHPWWTKLEQGGGLVDFCVGSDDIQSEIKLFRQAGIFMNDITSGSRLRPDGYRLSWLLSMPGGRFRGIAPFLIEDQTPHEERVPKEIKHENQVTGISALTIAVDDVSTIRRSYSVILQDDGQEIESDELNAVGVRFTLGTYRFDFVAPNGSESPLNNWLRVRGPSPYAAALRTVIGKAILLN